MKIMFLTIIAMLGMTAIATANTPETLTMRAGQQKNPDHGRLTVKLISVGEDSRCPVDVKCIWAGSAKITISVTKGRSSAKTYELNTGLDPRSVTVSGYEIRFIDLTPRPGEKQKMPSLPPTAIISVTKLDR